MLLESNPLFEIRKGTLGKKDGFQYEITLRDRNVPTGHVEVIFTSVESCRHDTRYGPLKEKGLKDTDKIANITEFRPYEKNFIKISEASETYTGRRIGSDILEEVIKDSSENGCEAIITLTGRDRMKWLLKKHNFIPTDHYEQEYYKLLISGSI